MIKLIGNSVWEWCERVPFPLDKGIYKLTRHWSWIIPTMILDPSIRPICNFLESPGHVHQLCPICNPSITPKDGSGVVWLGKRADMSEWIPSDDSGGVYERSVTVGSIPKRYKMGDIVYVAHWHALGRDLPGIIGWMIPNKIVVDNSGNHDVISGLLDRYGECVSVDSTTIDRGNKQ